MTWSARDDRLLTGVRHLTHVWCALTRPDRPPHVTALWFAISEGRVWFSSPSTARKIALVRDAPATTLAFAGTEDGGGAVLEGRAEVVGLGEGPGPAVLRALSEKYGGWDAADPRPWGPRVLVAVGPTRWLVRPPVG